MTDPKTLTSLRKAGSGLDGTGELGGVGACVVISRNKTARGVAGVQTDGGIWGRAQKQDGLHRWQVRGFAVLTDRCSGRRGWDARVLTIVAGWGVYY